MKRACKFGIEFNSRFRPAVAGGLIVFGNIRDYGGFGRYFLFPNCHFHSFVRVGLYAFSLALEYGTTRTAEQEHGGRQIYYLIVVCHQIYVLVLKTDGSFQPRWAGFPGNRFNEAKSLSLVIGEMLRHIYHDVD